MLVMDETGPTPTPPVTSGDHSEAQSLIVTGKRSRRKVNLSAEFLYDHPIRAQRLKVNDDEVSHGGDGTSPSHRKRRRPSGGHSKTPDELIIKRNRLQQRKLELEAYLKRLQVALAVERNHANGIGPAPAQLVPADPNAATTGPVADNGMQQAMRPATARRKSLPSSVKKKDTRPVPPPVVDDDNVDISLKACIRIIDDLIHNQYGDVFATPVDWVGLGLPSYPEIIKSPMDLGTIRQRLSSSFYSTLSAFIADVQLVWDNAKKFNLPKSFVHEATLEMERIWNRKKDYLKRERRKTLLSASKGEAAAVETPAVSVPALGPNPSQVLSRPLSLLEMSKLRADLVKVPSELYSRIAEITGSTVVTQPDSEAGGVLHVDVDKLAAETQRHLQQFVASVLPKNNARPRPAPAPTRKLSNSMTSVATAVISSESDSDSSSSSGLESDSSDDDHVVPPPLPITNNMPVQQESDTRAEEVVNTDAWSNLSADDPHAEEKTNQKQDPLWSDYQNMNAEAQQRKMELQKKEEARLQELERQAQERARLDEKARLEREELEKKRAEEAALREEERTRLISEEREKARRALEHDDNEADEADMGFLSSIFGS